MVSAEKGMKSTWKHDARRSRQDEGELDAVSAATETVKPTGEHKLRETEDADKWRT